MTKYTVECITPERNISEVVTISLSINKIDFSDTNVNFTYHGNVTIATIITEWGPRSGHTEISVIDHNFNFGSVDSHNPITLLNTFMYKFYDGRNENMIFRETWPDTTTNLINNTHIKIKSPTLTDPGNFHDTSQITNIANLKFDNSLNGFDSLLLNKRNNLQEINSPIAKFEYKANMIIGIECTNNLQDYTNFDRYFGYINDATLIGLYISNIR